MDRSIIALAACSILAALVMSSTAAAEIYRWDDEKGVRHLVNDINDVPARYREVALSDDAARRATNNQVNIMDSPRRADTAGAAEGAAPRGAPAAASAAPRPATNSMPGGQSEMWWRQTALQLQRNVTSARNALSAAQDRDDDDSVTISGRGRRDRGSARSGGGRARAGGRHPRGRIGGSGSSDYTEYSYERDLDELEVAVADAERAYQDFHNQARRAEVPPGWLRR